MKPPVPLGSRAHSLSEERAILARIPPQTAGHAAQDGFNLRSLSWNQRAQTTLTGAIRPLGTMPRGGIGSQ